MKSCRDKCLVLLLTILGSGSVDADSIPQWDEFLVQPNKHSFLMLESSTTASAQRCSWGDPDNYSVVPIEKRKQLFELIAEGNEFAFRIGLLIAKCLDGGDLEDFHRSVGLFLKNSQMRS